MSLTYSTVLFHLLYIFVVYLVACSFVLALLVSMSLRQTFIEGKLCQGELVGLTPIQSWLLAKSGRARSHPRTCGQVYVGSRGDVGFHPVAHLTGTQRGSINTIIKDTLVWTVHRLVIPCTSRTFGATGGTGLAGPEVDLFSSGISAIVIYSLGWE